MLYMVNLNIKISGFICQISDS